MKTKTQLKDCIFLIIIALFFSCNKNVSDEKIQSIENESVSDNKTMTHYVVDNLRLRDSADLSFSIIAVLPQFTTFNIIETGETETIDGITAAWIKIETQNGYTGWCFSGYVKQIESKTDDISNLPLILEKVDYSHIIMNNNFTVKFATKTADVKIYENNICIYEKDYVSQDTFIINNNIAIFCRNEKLIFFELNTKKEIEVDLVPLPVYYENFSSSNAENIFYASSDGGDVLRFNNWEGIDDKINKNKEWVLNYLGSDANMFIINNWEGIVDKIDEYKKRAVFVAVFSDGRILSIGTDDQQAPPYRNDLEIRLYDKFGKKIASSPINLQGYGRITSDYYFDNIDNILFIYNHTRNDMTNVYKFDNNSVSMQKMPEFGHIIKRIEYNNKSFFVTYARVLGKIYFYNTELELEAITDVYLSTYHEIADIEISENTIRVYEYLPGK